MVFCLQVDQEQDRQTLLQGRTVEMQEDLGVVVAVVAPV
jgi:hypothetical protein